MEKELKVWAMTVIAFWWLAPNQTYAQQDSIKTTQLSEVVITATKFPKNQTETGKVLTIIDEEQLSRSGGKDLAQVLNEQVGMVINGANSNPGKDKTVFLQGAKTEYTLILIDGIPVTDASGVGGAFDLRMLPLDQIQRVEILKGSQSTLYGTDAIAGVINIITKQKGEKPLGGTGTISYGSFNSLRGNASLGGTVKKFDYRASYSRSQSDGISEAKDTTGTSHFDKDGFHQDAWQLNLGYRPNERLSIRPFYRYTAFEGQYDAGAFTDDTVATFRSRLSSAGTTGQYQLHHGSVNVLYAHEVTQRTFVDQYGTYDYQGYFDHAEVFANYDLSDHYQLLAGVNHQVRDIRDLAAAGEHRTMHQVSPYLSFFVKNFHGFYAEAGGRYVRHSVFGDTFTYSLNPSYLLSDKLKLFLNYSTGFKAPTLNQLYGQYGANESLKPEKSKSFEGGVEGYSSDGRWTARVTVFRRLVKDVVVYSTIYKNLDLQDDHGTEVELTYEVSPDIRIKAFYGYVDGTVTTRNALGTDTTYHNLFKRPKHTVGVNLSWQVTPALLVTANLKTIGRRNDIYFNLSSFENRNVSLKAYQLLDVYAAYQVAKGRARLFVDARNVLNEDYAEVYGYGVMPFTVQGGLSLMF